MTNQKLKQRQLKRKKILKLVDKISYGFLFSATVYFVVVLIQGFDHLTKF